MKKLKVFLAIVLTVTALSHSKPSQATVGAFVGGPVLIAGLVLTGSAGIWSAYHFRKCEGGHECRGLMVLIAGIVLLPGLLVLDGEQGIEFKELTTREASHLGITASALEIYNSEVEQANMLMAEVTSELSRIEKPTEADSKVAWNNVKDLVSPATYSVMQKIASQQ